MPKQIEVPGQGVVEFPDDMTDDQIVAAIKKTSMLPKKKPSLFDIATSPNLAGGPLAMIGRAGLERVNKAVDSASYNVGGTVTDLFAGKAPPEVAAGAGYLANLGTQLGASYLFGKAGSAAGKATMQSAAKRTMQAAVKPTLKDLETGKAARAIETMLKENVGANQAGVAKLRAEVSLLDDEIDKAIKGSSAMVNKAEVGKRLKSALDKFKMQVNPDADMESIRKAWLEFRSHPLLVGKTQFPVQTAQALKRGTYKSLGEKAYGEMKGAEMEAQKALARGLKEEIAKAVPSVGPLNARQAELLNAANVAGRRAMMAGNNNLMGLAPIAPNTASMLAFLADRSPTAASYLANVLYQNAGVLPGGVANVAAMPLLMRSAQPPLLSEQR